MRITNGWKVPDLLALICAGQLSDCQQVFRHRRFHIAPCCSGLQIERDIERVEFEIVAMLFFGGRAGAAIRDVLETVHALFGGPRGEGRFCKVLREFRNIRPKIKQRPMRPQPGRRIRIIDNQNEALGIARRAFPGQWRGNVFPVASVLAGNGLAVLEGAAADIQLSASLRRGHDRARRHERNGDGAADRKPLEESARYHSKRVTMKLNGHTGY